MTRCNEVLALAGGVGGAKLAFGLSHQLRERLTVVVNTGDDFVHLGWHISPDLDTVAYTLAGLANREQGWGLQDETWSFMDQLQRVGGPDWFKLGDRDIAVHAYRSERLRLGATLTDVTDHLCGRFGVASRVLPMCNESVRTIIRTSTGAIPFQEYFVRLRCEPIVEGVVFDGIEKAVLNPVLTSNKVYNETRAIVICPSNPYLSVDPILSIPGAKQWLSANSAPIVAVSPIVGGNAIKGPAAKIMQELGIPSTAFAVAQHYHGLVDGIVIDEKDRSLKEEIEGHGIRVKVCQTVMNTDQDRIDLAAQCLQFADELADRKQLA